MRAFIIRRLVFSIVCLTLLGCDQSPASGGPARQVINQPGTFQLPSLDSELDISITEDDIVTYSVTQKTGKVLLQSTDSPSAFHRWACYWEDSQKELWFSSSDIGSSVWRMNKDGSFDQNIIGSNVTLIQKIPSELFDELPKSLQKKWSVHRK